MPFLLLALSQLSHPVTGSLKCSEHEIRCGSRHILALRDPFSLSLLHFVPSPTCCVLVGVWFYIEYAELMASEDSSSYTLTLVVAISLGKNVEDIYGCDELKFLRWRNYPDLSD